jgi:hypothetical protein
VRVLLSDAVLMVYVCPCVQASYNADQRLLKLHGCTQHPEDIVLTHEDYVEFMHSRPALQGMVQSLLMTKHVLFVGFGLQDDNLFQIFSSVKKSVNGRKGEDKLRTCTSLLVGASRLVREMWQFSTLSLFQSLYLVMHWSDCKDMHIFS